MTAMIRTTLAKAGPATQGVSLHQGVLRWPGAVLSLLVILTWAATARAGDGGKAVVDASSPIFVWSEYIAANSSASFYTYGLSAGSDTVLHIQDFPTGDSISGNDDCPGAVDNASCVYLGPVPYDRNVTILVRSYVGGATGTASLAVYLDGSLYDNVGPFSFGGAQYGTGALQLDAGSKIWLS